MTTPACAVHVVFEFKPEHRDAFIAAVQLQAKNSLDRESWCQQFDVCISPDQENKVMLYETYDDRAAFDKHKESTHLAEFNVTIADWVVQKEVSVWDIL